MGKKDDLMKQFVEPYIPPILTELLKKVFTRKYGWKGNYNTWEEAQKDATGYETQLILQKVKNALLKVKKGEAIYERDSVLFESIQYSWPLLSGLMLSAINKNKVSVLDFGGSLGSTYFQNKKFLDEIAEVSWSIIEQNHFVETGKEYFENERLKFYHSTQECIYQEHPNTLLLSSVLQYIEKPYNLLDELLSFNFEYILLDRTPFNLTAKETLKLQIVPPKIYKASYPCWFFNETAFKQFFVNKGYKLIEDFNGTDRGGDTYQFKGMIWRKNV